MKDLISLALKDTQSRIIRLELQTSFLESNLALVVDLYCLNAFVLRDVVVELAGVAKVCARDCTTVSNVAVAPP